MRLFTVFWIYGDHEMESEIFASEKGHASDGRKYLLSVYGGGGEYMSQPELLTDVSVQRFDTVHASNGDPYKVVLK